MECLFCNIAIGAIPSYRVYEDEHAMAFLDINPTSPGHTLVIPKKHSMNVFDVDEESLAHLMNAVKKVSCAIVKGLDIGGVNVIHNAGETAGQVIFHTHIHIVPRYADDGLKHWPGTSYESEEEARMIAQKISARIDAHGE